MRAGARGRELAVRSLHHLTASPFRTSEPLGYEVVNGGRAVATVETIDWGRVWMAPDLGERRETRSRRRRRLCCLLDGEE